MSNRFKKYARLVISTPGWDKIHHSDEQKYTDSHYGDIFTFCDRIFSNWHKVSPGGINYGLKDFDDDNKQTVGYQMIAPFKKI